MAKKQTFTREIEQMEIGERRDYPAIRCSSVRAMVSTLGFQFNRRYSTKIDKKRRVITVTRVK